MFPKTFTLGRATRRGGAVDVVPVFHRKTIVGHPRKILAIPTANFLGPFHLPYQSFPPGLRNCLLDLPPLNIFLNGCMLHKAFQIDFKGQGMAPRLLNEGEIKVSPAGDEGNAFFESKPPLAKVILKLRQKAGLIKSLLSL
jgi:hypothetical protein